MSEIMIQNKIFYWTKNFSLKIKKKSVLVGGCFDVFHYGHLFFLEQAKKGSESLIVLLESDEFIQIRKRKKPFHTSLQREKILSHIDIIDYVVVLSQIIDAEQYKKIVEKIHPKVIAYTFDDPMAQQKMLCAKMVDAQVKVIPYKKGFSSSLLHSYETISRN